MTLFLKNYKRIAKGSIDYFRHPEMRSPWGGPFNNQFARQALFLTLRAAFDPWALVETGVYRGSTTELFVDTRLPVFAVEADPHAFGFARTRFLRRRNITVFFGDSRAILKSLLDDPVRWRAEGANPFFYLDAHWEDDLPLAEELEIVFSRCPNAIVMIDDFEVPGDEQYGYDDYGPGKTLNAEYIAPSLAARELTAFYPSTQSSNESGARRGCVVLAKTDAHGAKLMSLPLLRPAPRPR